MINFNISYIQILVLVVVSLFTLKLIKILTTLLTSSPFFVNWAIKRQAKRRDLVEVDKRTQMYQDLQKVAKTIEWIDKQLPTTQKRKQFWRDFALTKSTRNEWMEKLLEQFKPQTVTKKSNEKK